MKGDKDVKISYWAAHLTTIVSVTLVLILVGIIALITLSSERETKRIKERLEVSVIMNDTVSDAYASQLADRISKAPYVLEVGVISKDQALKDWKLETGEDLSELFGINPLSSEIYFRIKSQYSSSDSLQKIGEGIKLMPGVDEIALPDSAMVESMNRNVENIAIILGVIAFVMMAISFVLINNTVHLSIYARRFTIHTMQLVGATNSFIRGPFVKNNIIAGLIASLVASGMIALSLCVAPHAGWNDVAHYIPWWIYACVAGGIIIVGPLLCGLAASVATSRYLKKDYDDLFE